MKKFKVNVKVPIQVTWTPEIVEDDSNFYMKMTPRVNTSGVAGAPRLTRVASGNTTRYMTVKHFNYNERALEEAKQKAIKIAKEDPDVKKYLIAGAKGKTISTPTQPVNTRPSVLDTIQVSEEDKALGSSIGRENYSEARSTSWTKKQVKEMEKEE